MRDLNRIPETLKELEILWKRYPDWRLGQLIVNLNRELTLRDDPFYLEDDKLLKIIKVINERERKRERKRRKNL